MLESNLEAQTKTILNNNQYNSIRKLGKGGFGHVLLATKATSSSTYYAIKCISKKKMIKDPQLKKFLIQEINTMAMLNHNNIVKLLKTFQESEWYFLVMECCDMGNLYNYQLKLNNKIFNLEEGLNIFLQIVYGLDYIHHNNIIHRDIKLENIFIKKNYQNGVNNYICKIGDFGLARQIGEEESAITNCGTEIYMAPEILSGQTYGKQADIWSLGVLLYHLLFGEFPFKGINMLDEIKNRCKNGYKLSQSLKTKYIYKNKKEELLLNDLFQRIFEVNPSKRITIKELKGHSLFSKEMNVNEESSTEEEQDQNVIEWQISRIQFIKRIVQKVCSFNFLTPYLTSAFKFYINKMLLYFLNREVITSYKNIDEDKLKLKNKLHEIKLKINNEIATEYNALLKMNNNKDNIDKFQDGFTLKVQDFSDFKVGYRNTIGKVYEETHKRMTENIQERSGVKLKLFICHIINRIFTGSVNCAIFPFYTEWIKKNNIKISQRFYDFNSLQEWIRHQKSQNLQRSQDIINQMFYK